MSLESVPRELVLCVQYDGKGISLVQDRHGDPGVPTMGYCASIIGGRLSIGHVERGPWRAVKYRPWTLGTLPRRGYSGSTVGSIPLTKSIVFRLIGYVDVPRPLAYSCFR